MFVDGVLNLGNSYGEEYIFHFHETYESDKFYYVWIACPILQSHTDKDGMLTVTTYRTTIDTKGSFRFITQHEGIDYETILIGRNDKYVICTNDNIDERFIDWLEKFQDDALYREIPPISALYDSHPELKV